VYLRAQQVTFDLNQITKQNYIQLLKFSVYESGNVNKTLNNYGLSPPPKYFMKIQSLVGYDAVFCLRHHFCENLTFPGTLIWFLRRCIEKRVK
jgi:hypothetical protein